MENEILNNLIEKQLHRDINGNLYGGIVISPTLGLSRELVIDFFMQKGLDVYANKNYELLKAIGVYKYNPSYGGNNQDNDFRMFYTPWFGN